MLVFLFVDGLGLSQDPRSPLMRLPLPHLHQLSAGFTPQPFSTAQHAYRVLDATLGTEGLPQSGTGQTTLLTGQNAATLLGQHQGPFPATALRGLLSHQSLPVWAKQHGLRVLHANGYRQEYLERALASRRNAFSSFAFAARAAGLNLLSLDHPQAVAPAFWPNPAHAASQLAQLAHGHDLVILEHWALDLFAHRYPDQLDERFIELDAFVGELMAQEGISVVVTSDHGNAEESWHTHHTTNPVPMWAWGPIAARVGSMNSLGDVAPLIRQHLLPKSFRADP